MTVFLCDLPDANSIIEEEKEKWIKNILEYIGINKSILESDIHYFREIMNQEGIEVDQHFNGDVSIYKKKWHDDGEHSGWLPSKEENLIAQWKEPKRIRVVEGNKVYYEIHLNEWSVINTKR